MKKIKKNWIYLMIGFLIVLVGTIFMSYRNANKATSNTATTRKQVNNNQTNNTNSEKTDNAPVSTDNPSVNDTKMDNPAPSVTPDVSKPETADNYYTSGLKLLSEQNYPGAIADFTKAIQLDQVTPNYYLKKSEAQYSGGDKVGAKDTINQGLEKIPGNDLLQNQLDILNSL